jgi:hypothetical protein
MTQTPQVELLIDPQAVPGVTLQVPVRYCPVHGKLEGGGWLTFNWPGFSSPMYCVRCMCELCEKLGVSVVTTKPP